MERTFKSPVKVKKNQITIIKHTKQWFVNRVEKSIFYRIKIENSYIRNYIKILNVSHAESLFVHQNVSGKRYFL